MSNLSFQLPDLLALTNSFPLRTNKNCKFATDGSEKWLVELVDSVADTNASEPQKVLLDTERSVLRSAKYGLLASLCSPACDAPQIRILTDFFTLVFISHIRILGGPSYAGHWHPWTSSTPWFSSVHIESVEDALELLSINTMLKFIVPPLRRISSRLPESERGQWNKQFSKSVKAFAKSQLRLYENLKSGTVPSLQEYVILRREAYASSMLIDLLDLLEISPRPSNVSTKHNVMLHQYTTWAIDIVAWILDIFSYASGTTGATRCNSHNLIALLTTHKNLSVQGAMNYAGGMVKEALEEFYQLERELLPSDSTIDGTWTWLGLVKSAVGLSDQQRPRPNWKFLADVLQPVNDIVEDALPQTDPTVLEQKTAETARYIRALKDYIIGSIHWGYETELYFGQKGDEVRSFGWVFLSHNDHNAAIRD